MKNVILCLALALPTVQIMAQSYAFERPELLMTDMADVTPVVRQNRLPMFSGGNTAFQDFVVQTARFPERAYREGLEGTVYVEVYVLPTGRLQFLGTKGNVGGGCEQEAVRIVSLMPAWKPALRQSIPVRYKVRIPITFKWQ